MSRVRGGCLYDTIEHDRVLWWHRAPCLSDFTGSCCERDVLVFPTHPGLCRVVSAADDVYTRRSATQRASKTI